MNKWAVVVVDGNGEVTVVGCYLMKWYANLMRIAVEKVVRKKAYTGDEGWFVVDVELAGTRQLGRDIRARRAAHG